MPSLCRRQSGCEIRATEEPWEDSKLIAKQGVYWKQGPSGVRGRGSSWAEASSQLRPVPTRVVLCRVFEEKNCTLWGNSLVIGYFQLLYFFLLLLGVSIPWLSSSWDSFLWLSSSSVWNCPWPITWVLYTLVCLLQYSVLLAEVPLCKIRPDCQWALPPLPFAAWVELAGELCSASPYCSCSAQPLPIWLPNRSLTGRCSCKNPALHILLSPPHLTPKQEITYTHTHKISQSGTAGQNWNF